jgi:hypothetical protein
VPAVPHYSQLLSPKQTRTLSRLLAENQPRPDTDEVLSSHGVGVNEALIKLAAVALRSSVVPVGAGLRDMATITVVAATMLLAAAAASVGKITISRLEIVMRPSTSSLTGNS